ncbi:TPA: hypothetical protein QCO88_001702 [Bacillus cereus]|uniref:hypothetical protein n=1 Tax=Bacillus TaxID=1386 RepID=UPI0016706BE9|nr:hypothetical protein [Bacillus wiedmannii]HDR3899196.1 hypothetical protein [Bacillus cereus]
MTILAWVVIAISLMFIVAVTTNEKYELAVRITTIVLFSPSLLLSVLYLIN